MKMNNNYLLSQVTNSGYIESSTVQTIKYKDYYGAIDVDVETNMLCGRVLYLKELITFKAETVEQAKIEFAKSVNDYLEFKGVLFELDNNPNDSTLSS